MQNNWPFTMADVVSLLGLPQPPPGRSSYNINCPNCDDRKRHLNINLAKGVFRCPRCEFSGGVLDLYGYYTGTQDRQEIYKAIIERLPASTEFRRETHKQRQKPELSSSPLCRIETRDTAYRALLSQLTLASDHLDNLQRRGLSKHAIDDNLYRTTPRIGYTSLCKQLLAQGISLAGVPGFFRKEGQWTLAIAERGILIPVRDLEGRIQGLQIRLDHVDKRKFRWLSSTDSPEGCGANSWVHIAGPLHGAMILTEGPMKADIIHHLTGYTVLGMTGVSAIQQLTSVLESIKEKGVTTIMTAFDMDMMKNPHVQSAFRRLQETLDRMGFRFGTYLWDPRYKGLDNYALMLSRLHAQQDHEIKI